MSAPAYASPEVLSHALDEHVKGCPDGILGLTPCLCGASYVVVCKGCSSVLLVGVFDPAEAPCEHFEAVAATQPGGA